MKKNDLLKVYEHLLSLENQRFLIELGVAAFNETVRVFQQAKLIRPEEPARVDEVPEPAAMARVFHRRFRSTRDQGDLTFRRLAASFRRDLGGRPNYEFLRGRCQQLPNFFSCIVEHWNGIKHRREVVSMSQVLNLSSSIQRVLELAPPAFREAKAQEIKPLLQQCELAQRRCLPAGRADSEATTGRSSPSRPTSLSVDFPTRVAGPVARVLLRPVELGPRAEFQIDSVDGPFTTGRQRLDGEREVEVPLAWHGENRFQVWTFDTSGVPIHSHGPFGIVRTEAPSGALTAARSLLLAAAGQDGEAAYKWLVRKGAPLPVKDRCVFRLRAPSEPAPTAPSLIVCESDGRDLHHGLFPLGRILLPPEHLSERGTDAEIEIRCDYRVLDPGHVQLDISVPGTPPEARLTRTFAYSQGQAAESATEALDRESRDCFHVAAQWMDIMEDWQREDPDSERDPALIEAEDLFYGLQSELRDLAREVLGIEPSNILLPLDEWLGGGGEFEFVGVKEQRTLMASPQYVTLLREAVAKAATWEFDGQVSRVASQPSVSRFRELASRINAVPLSLPDGPQDRAAFLRCIEEAERALRDVDLDRLEAVVAAMSALLPASFCRPRAYPGAAERAGPGGTAARWLPLNWEVAECAVGRKVDEGQRWQRYATSPGHLVVATRGLADWWVERGLLEETALTRMKLGDSEYAGIRAEWVVEEDGEDDFLAVVRDVGLGPVGQYTPDGFGGALRLARSVAESRRRTDASFHDAIYSARLGRLLPTLSGTFGQTDDVVLGCCLTGGFHVPASSMELMQELTTLDEEQTLEVLEVAGLTVIEAEAATSAISAGFPAEKSSGDRGQFRLPGRPDLEASFNEEIIEAVQLAERHPERIPWPGGLLLHGPSGCGKTFAVERLIAFLGWEEFRIDAGTVGSPYIHETSRKVAEVFQKAKDAAPSVVVIDEMEAFLSARQSGEPSRQHHVEEVGEFLPRIQEASSQRVLVVGMTNQLDLIDSAILRSGRFDCVLEVGMPSAEDVGAVLREALQDVDLAPSLTLAPAIEALSGRKLSDVALLVKWLKRGMAKANENESEWILDRSLLNKCIERLPKPPGKRRRSSIGFGAVVP